MTESINRTIEDALSDPCPTCGSTGSETVEDTTNRIVCLGCGGPRLVVNPTSPVVLRYSKWFMGED